ncbi:MAG: hypothetical protein ABF290_10840 [Thiogranum sp.]
MENVLCRSIFQVSSIFFLYTGQTGYTLFELGDPRSPGLFAYQTATYATLGRMVEASTIPDPVNLHDGKFDWKDWLQRAFRGWREAERVLRPLRQLDNG